MKRTLVTINLKRMNAISIAMCASPMLISLPLQWTVLKGLNQPFELWDLLIVAIAMPLLFILHEGVHAISFMLTGAPKGSVKFGAIPKKMMLYCTTTEPLPVKGYAISLLMPLIFTGIIPWIISTVCLNAVYSILFATLISGAAGDVTMLIELNKHKKAVMIMDHPFAPAFYAIYKEEDFPSDLREPTEEDEADLRKTYK